MPRMRGGTVVCASLNELIAALEAVRDANGGDMIVEMATDAIGSNFNGLGRIELDSCDCCADDLLNLIPCTCEEDAMAEFAPGEVDYIEVDFTTGFGSLN